MEVRSLSITGSAATRNRIKELRQQNLRKKLQNKPKKAIEQPSLREKLQKCCRKVLSIRALSKVTIKEDLPLEAHEQEVEDATGARIDDQQQLGLLQLSQNSISVRALQKLDEEKHREEVRNAAKQGWQTLRKAKFKAPRTRESANLTKLTALASEALALIAAGKVVIEVEEGTFVPTSKQGDLSMYSTENLQRRQELCHQQPITDLTKSFWNLLEISTDVEPCITFEGYSKLMNLLYKLLSDDMDSTETQSLIQTDWERDAQEKDQMNFKMFHEALFELVDLWCSDISLDEYSSLLLKMQEGITEKDKDGNLRLKKIEDVEFSREFNDRVDQLNTIEDSLGNFNDSNKRKSKATLRRELRKKSILEVEAMKKKFKLTATQKLERFRQIARRVNPNYNSGTRRKKQVAPAPENPLIWMDEAGAAGAQAPPKETRRSKLRLSVHIIGAFNAISNTTELEPIDNSNHLIGTNAGALKESEPRLNTMTVSLEPLQGLPTMSLNLNPYNALPKRNLISPRSTFTPWSSSACEDSEPFPTLTSGQRKRGNGAAPTTSLEALPLRESDECATILFDTVQNSIALMSLIAAEPASRKRPKTIAKKPQESASIPPKVKQRGRQTTKVQNLQVFSEATSKLHLPKKAKPRASSPRKTDHRRSSVEDALNRMVALFR